METRRESLDSLAKEEFDEGIYESITLPPKMKRTPEMLDSLVKMVADEGMITLPPEKFQEFVDAIDKPMEPNSRLRELLTTPSVIELGEVETIPIPPKENK
jgi:hypothetical protein